MSGHISGKRSLPLDGIRGIAILMAVSYHIWQEAPALTLLDGLVRQTTSFLWTGVDLFFVLSGFLITRILFNTRNSEGYFRSFYARRMLRTWPLYYFALVLVLGIPALQRHRLVQSSAFWFVLHSSNFLTVVHGYPRRIVAHFWSLAIEEQFYLVWPSIRFLKSRERMMTLCGSLIVLAVASRFVLITAAGANSRQIYALTLTRMDALAAGGLLGLWLSSSGDQPRRRRLLAFLATVCGVILALGLIRDGGAVRLWGTTSQTLNYTAIAGLCACFIGWSMLSAGDSFLNRALSWRPLPFFGKYSYSMYMFHIWLDAIARARGLQPAVTPLLKSHGFVGATLPMVAYFLVHLTILSMWALVTWHVIEKRFLALKDRFEYRVQSAPAVALAHSAG